MQIDLEAVIHQQKDDRMFRIIAMAEQLRQTIRSAGAA
jgi:hypothetical protein